MNVQFLTGQKGVGTSNFAVKEIKGLTIISDKQNIENKTKANI